MQVFDQVLLPGAAMLEAALSAASLLLEGANLGSSTPVSPLLSGVSIPAPLLLFARSPMVLECLVTVSSSAAAVSVQSGGSDSGRAAAVHLRGALVAASDASAVSSLLNVRRPVWSAAVASQAAAHAAAPGLPPGAAAQLDAAQHQPGSGYSAHPAVLDASLHLGALLGALPDQAQPGSGGAPVRVPAALSAFHAARGATHVECWAAVGDVLPQPGDAALSSYWLLNGAGSAAGASMQGLLARPIKAAAPATARTAEAASESRLLYSLQWTAAETAVGSAGSRSKHAALTWRSAAGVMMRVDMRGGSLGAAALQASAASLAWLQQMLSSQGGRPAGVQLQQSTVDLEGISRNSAVRSSMQSAALAAAGASGLLRTAAQEYPGVKWRAYSRSLLAASSQANVLPADADAFGARLAESVLRRPQMLPSAPGPADSVLPSAVPHGSLAITGGLGGIGLLSGLWAAEQHTGLQVHLLGRSGHALAVALPVLARMSCVTVTRCDVGSPEEAAQLARRAGPPLRQIWHAGGLLQDATLPNQSLASLRAVAAPKLDGVLRLSAAAAQLPLDAVALFSSTAALLGPPGQGNYAAANAQLNAWSQGRQAAGACSRWTSWWV